MSWRKTKESRPDFTSRAWGPPSPHRDLGTETIARDKLECSAQGKLLRVLGRCPTLDEDASAILPDHEIANAAVGLLTNPRLDLFDERYHEVTPVRKRHQGMVPALVT